MRRWAHGLAITALFTAVGGWSVHAFLMHRYGVSELTVGAHLALQWLGVLGREPPLPSVDGAAPGLIEPPAEIELDPRFTPFREVGARLGARAEGNASVLFRGGAIFDANGDGRLDVYLVHSGRPIPKVTTADHLLIDAPVPAKPCSLFLNLGNDDRGDPVFQSIQDLQASSDGRLAREELLIENKYRPRARVDQDEFRPGRIAVGAVAADFNGDARLDLYVLNMHHGVMAQTHQLGIRAYPARSNLGRAARDERDALVIRFPSFLWGERSDGLVTTVELDGKREPEGRNSLFLNLGDRDGDGMPEWEDATDRLGVGGHHASASAAVADFDRDGDLDLYVVNSLDPDFWGFGASAFAGNRNQLLVNQLAETGTLGFEERAAELGVAGLHEQDGLEASVWLPAEGRTRPTGVQIVEGRQVGEPADHSWSATSADWNGDGWPDLVVANDIANRLRVYRNLGGTGFRYLDEFNDPKWDGCWMGMSSGDLDGDLADEIVVTNCGAQVMSVRNNALFIEDNNEASLQALLMINYPLGKSTLHHAFLRRSGDRLQDVAPRSELHHSPFIPPDQSNPANFAPGHREFFERNRFATSVTSLEFAWNAPMFDVDNDGDLDIYMAGSLARGNDGFVGDWSGSPGRMLVNESRPGELAFSDRTLEYGLLDITHMDYDYNPPRRPSPGTGWHKRDYVYLTDTDGYQGSGVDASRSETHDIFRMHEAANAVLAADLNADGFEDLLVTHTGGYNSLSPDARNLKVAVAGRTLAVPAPNKVVHSPTNFENGKTFVYLSSGAPAGSPAHWVKVRLHDPTTANRFGVGARVIANGKIARRFRPDGAAFGRVSGDLHVGLGGGALRSLEVHWPSGDMAPQRLELDPPLRDRVVCVDRQAGVVDCSAPRD